MSQDVSSSWSGFRVISPCPSDSSVAWGWGTHPAFPLQGGVQLLQPHPQNGSFWLQNKMIKQEEKTPPHLQGLFSPRLLAAAQGAPASQGDG